MIRKVILMLWSSVLVSAGIIGTDYSPATSASYSSISSPTIIKTVSNPISYSNVYEAPPVYKSLLTTKESKYESPDGIQHTTFSKSYDTSYSNGKKFETILTKHGDVITNNIPNIYSTGVHSPIVYHQERAFTYSAPLVHTVSAPAYNHEIPYTKTIVSPSVSSYATPVVSKTKLVTSGLSSYSTPSIHTISSPTLTKSISLPVTYIPHNVPIDYYSTPVLSKGKAITSGLSSYSSNTSNFKVQPIKTSLSYSEAPIVSHMSFSGLGANYAW